MFNPLLHPGEPVWDSYTPPPPHYASPLPIKKTSLRNFWRSLNIGLLIAAPVLAVFRWSVYRPVYRDELRESAKCFVNTSFVSTIFTFKLFRKFITKYCNLISIKWSESRPRIDPYKHTMTIDYPLSGVPRESKTKLTSNSKSEL